MRYVVLTLYVVWTLYSLRAMWRDHKSPIREEFPEMAQLWMSLHILAVILGIITGFIYLCVNYW